MKILLPLPKKYLILFFLLLAPCLPPAMAQELPSPEQFFGFKVGADFHLLTYSDTIEYWKALADLSGKIRLIGYGRSSQGRPMILAAVSSEENLLRAEMYRDISKKLSLVRGVAEEEARKLSQEGKAIVWIDGGLHGDEVAPAQHIIQLTYDLLTDGSGKNKRILDEVIALLVLPNPDGMEMVSRWYKGNLGTPYETRALPWLNQEYIGHDNNRDSFMLSVPETQNINRAVNFEWYPHVFYNHHQRSPFPSLIFVPPDSEPTNPNLHPLLLRWQNFIGAGIAKAFESEGKQGVISRFLFDTWYPGYVTQVCDFHNIISTFSETFLYAYATPHFYTVDDFPEEYKDFTISLFFTNPWQGGWWRLRDAVEYCLTASKSVLELAANHREDLLYAKYAMGLETIERYKKSPPFGWIIPLDQRDSGATKRLLNLLLALDLEVYQAEKEFKADGLSYPAGTYILPTSQPFGRLLKTLFEIQTYPDLRRYPSLWQGIVDPLDLKVPPLRTYDVLGWTLPLQMGVETSTLHTPLAIEMKRIKEIPGPKGRVSEAADYGYIIPYNNIDSVPALNELLEIGTPAFWLKEGFTESGRKHDAGSVLIPRRSLPEEKMKSLARKYGLEVRGLKNQPSVPTLKLKLPRIALYQPWTDNIDEGWTRLVLKNHGFHAVTVHNAELRSGGLTDRFDVLILPDENPEFLINGHAVGTMPPRYVGGISSSGIRSIREFVKNGGMLVAMGDSCDYAIEHFSLPLVNILKTLARDEFFASGLLLRIIPDEEHPLAFGLPGEVASFFANSPTFISLPARKEAEDPHVVGRFPGENIVLSGWMVGEKKLQGKAAVVEISFGKGKIILLGVKVQHRGQTVGTFKLLFNALFYSAAQAPKSP